MYLLNRTETQSIKDDNLKIHFILNHEKYIYIYSHDFPTRR